MRQFFLKSVLSLSISVGALSASTNSTDLSDPVAPSTSSSTSSTSLTVVEDARHPASIPVAFLAEQQDTQGKTQTVDIGFWNNPGLPHLVKQEVVSYLDPQSVYNFYRAGYINKWMWNALSGDTGFLAADVRQKLFLVALAIQTKDFNLFLQDQAPYFGRLPNAHLLGLFNSKDLSGYLTTGTATRAKYDLLAVGQYAHFGEARQNLRLIPPQGLKDNTSVHFGSNKLTVLSGLEQARSLRHIEVSRNRLVALPDLATFPDLLELRAANNLLATIKVQGQKTNLKLLELGRNKLSQISDLEGLVGLQHLDLGDNNFTGSLDLSNQTQLVSLHVQGNKISEINGVDRMVGLQNLTLSGNPITSLPSFRGLIHLTDLKLDRTGFTTLRSLAGLARLQECNLAGNGLTSLEDLQALPKLWKLQVESNRLRSAESLTRMTNLCVLNLADNDFESLDSLTGIQYLLWLHLDGNSRLTSLESLAVSMRGQIKDLSIKGTPIASLNPLRDMTRLENLEIDAALWTRLRDSIIQNVRTLKDQGFKGPNVYYHFINYGEKQKIDLIEREPREPSMPLYSDF